MDQGASVGETTRRSRPASRGTAAYQRRRAVKACQVCRARRTKCDNLRPSCSFCLKVGATCIQSAEDLSSFDPASLKILERLDSLEQVVRSSLSASASAEPRTAATAQHDCARVTASMVTVPDSAHLLSWGCLRGLRDSCLTAQESEGDTPHQEQHQQRQQQKIASSQPSQPSSSGLIDVPDDPRHIKALLNSFFKHVHVKNPILNEASTRSMVLSKMVDGGLQLDWDPDSCLTLLICALGSLACPFGPSTSTMPGTPAYAQAHAYFRAAQRRLGVLFSARDAIIAAQCFFFAGVFTMCNLEPCTAWRYFVQALASCQDFALLATSTPPSAPWRPDEEGLRDPAYQAIYWSAWKSEREVRGYARRPDFPIENGHDSTQLYPSFFPTPPVASQEPTEQTSWYFYLAEISLRRLSVRVKTDMLVLMETHATSRHLLLEALAEALPAHEAQVRQWQASLPSCLSLDAPSEQDDVCRFVLRGHLMDAYETLYWPFLAAYLDDDAERLISVSSDRFREQAQRGLETQLARLLVNKAGYLHRHHGTDPLLRSCSRTALVLMAANVTQRLQLPHGWMAEVAGVVKLLAYWSPETTRYADIQQILARGVAEIEAENLTPQLGAGNIAANNTGKWQPDLC